jgi:septation ring formation regulator EzrA
MENVWIYIIGPLFGAIATIVTAWLTGFRKQKVEVKGLEIQNFDEYLKTNNLMISDMKAQIAELLEARKQDRIQNQELQDKVVSLTRSNKNLCKEIAELKESLCIECPRRNKKS